MDTVVMVVEAIMAEATEAVTIVMTNPLVAVEVQRILL